MLILLYSDETGGGPSAGLPISDYRWDRTVLVSGLPPFTDPVEVYELEKALYTLFADYAPEAILVVGGKGLAYARVRISHGTIVDYFSSNIVNRFIFIFIFIVE